MTTVTVPDEKKDAPVDLTPRQRAVLVRFIGGHSVESIARELHCSPWTIRTHIADIAEKITQGKSLPPARRVLVYGATLLAEGS